jgi:hypothetical protein
MKWLLALTGLAWLAEGCTTSLLWEQGRFANYHQPANPANLSVFHSERDNDLLIQYDESCESNGSIRRRTYWAGRNKDRVRDRRQPRFISADEAHGGSLEPVEMTGDGLNDPSQKVRAVHSTKDQTLTVIASGGEVTHCQLPVYADASGRVKQVLLTPLTVAADLTIIGGVIGYYCLPSLGNLLNH